MHDPANGESEPLAFSPIRAIIHKGCEIMKRVSFLICLGLLASSPAASARTWYVTPDSTGDAPTITAGVDSASYGDTVLVAPGTYYSDSTGTEDWTWIRMKDGVALISEEGAEGPCSPAGDQEPHWVR